MRTESEPFRVRYADTDAQRVAYYGSYFTWFEVGLIRLLDQLGVHLPTLDAQGRVFVTAESYARFRRPARYDDLLVVRSRVAQAAPKRAVVEHEVVRADAGQRLASGGETDVLVQIEPGAPGRQTVLPMLGALLDVAHERVEQTVLNPRAEQVLAPPPPGARQHTGELQVRYAETDAQGLAYYGSYYAWFEAGRNELTRSLGLPYSALERRDVFLPVAQAYCRHHGSLRACERFRMTTTVSALSQAKITFTNRLVSLDGLPIADGYTLHGCTGPDNRPHGFPPEIVDHFAPSRAEPPPGNP